MCGELEESDAKEFNGQGKAEGSALDRLVVEEDILLVRCSHGFFEEDPVGVPDGARETIQFTTLRALHCQNICLPDLLDYPLWVCVLGCEVPVPVEQREGHDLRS